MFSDDFLFQPTQEAPSSSRIRGPLIELASQYFPTSDYFEHFHSRSVGDCYYVMTSSWLGRGQDGSSRPFCISCDVMRHRKMYLLEYNTHMHSLLTWCQSWNQPLSQPQPVDYNGIIPKLTYRWACWLLGDFTFGTLSGCEIQLICPMSSIGYQHLADKF